MGLHSCLLFLKLAGLMVQRNLYLIICAIARYTVVGRTVDDAWGAMVQGRRLDARTVGGENVAELGAEKDSSTSLQHRVL
jgi:hypothetical protein